MILYFMLAILHPFISSTTGKVSCDPVQAMTVYVAYHTYVLISTIAELGIITKMKMVLKSDSGLGTLSCNRYL